MTDSDVIVISDDDESSLAVNHDRGSSPQPGPSNDVKLYSMYASDPYEEKYQRDLEMAIAQSLMLQKNGPKKSADQNSACTNTQTWCKTRTEKSLKLNLNKTQTHDAEFNTYEDSDLPDLDEIVSVQVFEEEQDNDCVIVNVEKDLSTFSNKVTCPLRPEVERRPSSTSPTDCTKIMSKTSGHSFSSGKSAFSVVKPTNYLEQETNTAESAQVTSPSSKLKPSFILSDEHKNKLANIFKKTHKTLEASKSPCKKPRLSQDESNTNYDSDKSPKTNSNNGRHFLDMFDHATHYDGELVTEKENIETKSSKTNSKFRVDLNKIKLITPSFKSVLRTNGEVEGQSSNDNTPAKSETFVSDDENDVDDGETIAVDFHDSESEHSCNESDVELIKIDKYIDGCAPGPQKKMKLDTTVKYPPVKQDIYKIVNMKLGKPNSGSIMGPPKTRPIRKSEMESSEDITIFFEENSKTHVLCDWQKMQHSRVDFPSDELIEESLSSALSELHINTFFICLEEEGSEFLSHALKFAHDFSIKQKPTVNIVNEIIRRGVLDCKDMPVIQKAINILQFILQKHPDVVKIEWDMIRNLLDQLNLGKSHEHQEVAMLMKASLFLRFVVKAFQTEIQTKDVSDTGLTRTFRQFMSYSSLSYDCAFSTNLKQLINNIICCLTWGEFQEIAPFFKNRTQNNDDENNDDVLDEEIKRREVCKLLPLLQQLLHIGIEMSSNCMNCANMCAKELFQNYKYLSFAHKKLLLQTMVSSLLRYNLVTLMLETYGESGSVFGAPGSLQCVFECYFDAKPPHLPFTPPTTPQSEEEGPEGQVGPHRQTPQYSQLEVEELAMLQYYALCSYLQYTKNKTNIAMRRRLRMKASELSGLPQQDVQQIKNLPAQVDDLRRHLTSLNSDLTPATEQYLMMMVCLDDPVHA